MKVQQVNVLTLSMLVEPLYIEPTTSGREDRRRLRKSDRKVKGKRKFGHK